MRSDPARITVDDRFAGNNSFATATNLDPLSTIKIENNLYCNNDGYDDYFKFTLNNDGVKGSLVKINPVTTGVASQQLALRVYNSNQQEIGYISNTTGELVVSLETAKAGEYYIRVSRASTGTNGYSLTIAPFDDIYEDNDTFATAAPLSAQSTNIARREVLPIIRQETFKNLRAFDDDWYKFETFGTGDANSCIEIEYIRSAGILNLQLYNSSNQLMYTASNSFTRDGKDVLRMTLNNNILSPGMYYIKVSGINTGTYDLTINPPERSVITDVESLRPNGASLSGEQVFLRTIPINHTDSMGNKIGRKDFSFTIDCSGDLNSKITVQTLGAENGRITLLDSYGGVLDFQDIFAANTMITGMTTTVEASENGTVTVSTTDTDSYNWGVGVKTGVSGWKFNLELSGNYGETHGTSTTITQSSQYGIKIGQTISYKFDMPAAEFSLAGLPAGDYILRFESGVIDPDQKGYSAIISTNVPVTPVVPTITATAISSDTVLLSWEVDFKVKDYQIDIYEKTTGTYLEDYDVKSYDMLQPGIAGAAISGLNAGTEYDFRLIASNNAGESTPAAQSTTTFPDAHVELSAPTNLTAVSTGARSIRLNWDDVSGAVSYNVYQYRSGAWECVATVTDTTYTRAGLTTGVAYAYQVAAVDANGNESPRTPTIRETTSFAAGVTAAPVGTKSITVSWAKATGAVSYDVWRYQGGWILAAENVTDASYTRNGLTVGAPYSFRVDAKDANGNVLWQSGTVKATTYTTPFDVTAVATGTKSITLSWDDLPGAAGYDVYRYQGGWLLAAADLTDLSYTRNGLTPGASYAFRVVAKDTDGNMLRQSETVKATTWAAAPAPAPINLYAAGSSLTATRNEGSSLAASLAPSEKALISLLEEDFWM